MFGGKLPKDFCTLFWNTFFSLLFLPFMVVTALMDRWLTVEGLSNCLWRILYGVLVVTATFAIHAVGVISIMKMFTEGADLELAKTLIAYGPWLYILFGLAFWIGAALALFAIILACMGVVTLVERFAEAKVKKQWAMSEEERATGAAKQDEPSKVKVTWDTFRNKYCTKIEWR